MKREFIPDDFDEEPKIEDCRTPPPEDRPLCDLVDEQIRILGLLKDFPEVMEDKPGDCGEEPWEEDDQLPPPEPRPCDLASEGHRHPHDQEDGFTKLMATMRKRKEARERAREAKSVTAHLPRPPREKPNEEPASRNRTRVRSLPAVPPASAESSRGVFLLNLENGETTWRLQLFAFKPKGGPVITKFHFHPWKRRKDGLLVSCGPGLGFSVSLKEVKSLIKALQEGIRMVDSGEFDPKAEGNLLPRRKQG